MPSKNQLHKRARSKKENTNSLFQKLQNLTAVLNLFSTEESPKSTAKKVLKPKSKSAVGKTFQIKLGTGSGPTSQIGTSLRLVPMQVDKR